MAIDSYYTWIAAGSRATSAATAHNLFGTYDGLSNLSTSEVLTLQVFSVNRDFWLSANPRVSAANESGLLVTRANGIVQLPPMVRTEASQITIARTGGNNPTAHWVIWNRVS